MSEFRYKSSGEVRTKSELIAEHPNVSFPAVWNENVLEMLGVDTVFVSPMPEAGKYQEVQRNGVEQDAKGNWVQAWKTVDMFADSKDSDGNTVTKAEAEAAYQAQLDSDYAANMRVQRNNLLAETDFYALSDVTMSNEMKTYRQALRDLPSQSDWPYVDFPTKP